MVTAPVGNSSATIDEERQVCIAFAVGWQVAELYYAPVAEASRQPHNETGLVRVSNLGPADVERLRLEQIREGLQKLDAAANEAVPLIDASLARTSGVVPETRAEELHEAVLIDLTASDFRLGKAYSIGCALATTTMVPRFPRTTKDPRPIYQEQFDPKQLQDVYGWIADLKTVLPNHAAYATSWSLQQWQWWVSRADPEEDWDQVDLTLRRQGQQWRALLSGERQPKDLLTAMSYVDAAKGLSARLGRTIGAFVSRYKGFVFGSLLLLGALVGGLSYWASQGENAKATWAGITAVVGLIGGWRGVSGTLGRSLGTAEEPLWDAELDGVIAQRVVLLPPGAAIVPPLPEEVGVLQGDAQPHPLWVDPDSLDVGVTGHNYNKAIRLRGGTPPYRIKLKRSYSKLRNHFPLGYRRLPPGFHLTASDEGRVGIRRLAPRRSLLRKSGDIPVADESGMVSTLWVSGISTRSRQHTVRVHVSDSSTPKQYARRHLLIDIRSPKTNTVEETSASGQGGFSYSDRESDD